jgi:hypothetical protein
MPRPVGRLRAPGGDGDELVAHIDERHATTVAPAQLELEEPSVPGERFLEVADFERDVVYADQTSHGSMRHRSARADGAALVAALCGEAARAVEMRVPCRNEDGGRALG